MPGMLLHVGALVQCVHGGQAMPVVPYPRVTVNGLPIVLQTTLYRVSGCSFVPPISNGPCAAAVWITAALRITANNIPVLLSLGQSLCRPTNTALRVTQVQPRVKGL